MALIINDIAMMPQEEVVLTIGFFDGVHLGHRFLLNHLRETATAEGLHSAMLTFWPHPRCVLNQTYQPLLLNTLDEKRERIQALPIDYCLQLSFTKEFAALSAFDFMKYLAEQVHVRHLIIGYDHRFGHNRTECFEDYCRYGEVLGMEVSKAPEYEIDGPTISSSVIRRLLSSGNIAAANQCLGYRYSLTGKVVTGKQIGRTMGFPTANLEADAHKCIPATGVYVVTSTIRETDYTGVLCIGNRPTFEENGQPSIEVHLLDFSGDLYGSQLTVHFVEKIREQQKFATRQELSEAIHKDIQHARNLLTQLNKQ